MGKIYNYDTGAFIGGVAQDIAKHHGVKKGVKPSEHRPHAEKTAAKGKAKPSKGKC